MLRGTSIAIQAFLKKEEKSQIDSLTYHLKELQKEEQTKLKASTRKEIIKIKEEINKTEIQKKRKKERKKPNESWFFERTKKIEKVLARLIKKRKELK